MSNLDAELLKLVGHKTTKRIDDLFSSEEESEDLEEEAEDSDSNNDIPEYKIIKSWGTGLTGDEKDKRMLDSLSVLDREEMLAERAEKKQMILERLLVKEKLGLSKSRVLKKKPAKVIKQFKKQSRIALDEDNDETEVTDVVTLELFRKTIITRKDLDKICHAPFFDEILNLNVRIAFQNKYYVAQITGICEYPPYKMPDSGTITTKGLLLRQNTQTKEFRMSWISNSPPLINEFSRFILDEPQSPSIYNHLVHRLNRIRNHVFTEEEINKNIMSNQQASTRRIQDTNLSKTDGMMLLNERNRKFNLDREKNGKEVKKDFWDGFDELVDSSGGYESIYEYLQKEYCN